MIDIMKEYALVRVRYSYDTESKEYSLAGYSKHLSEIKLAAKKSSGEPGDLLFICDVDNIATPQKECIDRYIVDEEGAPRSYKQYMNNPDIIGASDYLTLSAMARVGKKDIVSAVLACAKTVTSSVSDYVLLFHELVRKIELWIVDDCNFSAVSKAKKDLAKSGISTTKYSREATVIYYVVNTIENEFFADEVSSHAAKISKNPEQSMLAMGLMVREYIPIKSLFDAFKANAGK